MPAHGANHPRKRTDAKDQIINTPTSPSPTSDRWQPRPPKGAYHRGLPAMVLRTWCCWSDKYRQSPCPKISPVRIRSLSPLKVLSPHRRIQCIFSSPAYRKHQEPSPADVKCWHAQTLRQIRSSLWFVLLVRAFVRVCLCDRDLYSITFSQPAKSKLDLT